jgi:hypothetical protein
MRAQRSSLPAHSQRAELLRLLDDGHRAILVSGATGSGKTTQVAQFILEHADERGQGSGCSIVCTQPRRIAAISVAERVAAERGEGSPGALGASVGYHVRLEACRGPDTRLLFCTTGVLLRMLCAGDSALGCSHIVVDEVHERDMQTDLLLLLLKLLLPACPHLTVVLMSATMSLELFQSYFGGCPVVGIEGRTFPVSAVYLEDVLAATGHQILPGAPAALPSVQASVSVASVTVSGSGGTRHTQRVQWEEEDGAGLLVGESWEEGRYDAYPPHVSASLKRCDESKINFDLIEVGAASPLPPSPLPSPCSLARPASARPQPAASQPAPPQAYRPTSRPVRTQPALRGCTL